MDKFVRNLNGHTESVNTVKFTSDGNFCMTVSNDKTAKLWNPHKQDPSIKDENRGLLIKSYAGNHGYKILDICIYQDNSKFITAGGDKACFLVDVTTGRLIRRIQAHTSTINTIAMNTENTILLTGSYDQTVCIWDMRAYNREPLQAVTDCKDSVTSLVTSSHQLVIGSLDKQLRIYDLRMGLCHYDDLMAPITCIRLSQDEKSVLCTCLDNYIKLIDIDSGSLLNQYYGGHSHASYKIESCFVNDDYHILTGSENGDICHYNILKGDISRSSIKCHQKTISGLAYHPKEAYFISTCYDGTVSCWDSEPYID